MFTGIIEMNGIVKQIFDSGSNKTFWLQSALTPQLKVDQSLSHDGVCLTVEEIKEDLYRVTAVNETLQKTNLSQWKEATKINLERSLQPTSRLDGHFVQGHVDATGICRSIIDLSGSWEITFEFPEKFAPLVIEKGSICVNGVSLTAFNVTLNTFTIAVIPYTWNHTNLNNLLEGSVVNLEFDMIGKYIFRKYWIDDNKK